MFRIFLSIYDMISRDGIDFFLVMVVVCMLSFILSPYFFLRRVSIDFLYLRVEILHFLFCRYMMRLIVTRFSCLCSPHVAKNQSVFYKTRNCMSFNLLYIHQFDFNVDSVFNDSHPCKYLLTFITLFLMLQIQ